ncbi:phosphatidylinositol-specific phospholipase C1-like protein [Pedobacter miscanthi]|uniref:phosphatidylinositol-specific phospholipase C1-like protein n=1 Tax=Pedobacter miscanthi TaxID=2259170 RepID=UPI00292FCDB3|nr:phosphatidylinositol-specific phospholipase C1-like protein [Pedobacter miscanthi]
MKLFLTAFCFFAVFFYIRQNIDENTPINKIQVIGSHNSYKKAIDPALIKFLSRKDSTRYNWLDYEHTPLVDQLSMGLCNLEIDVYSDKKGGRFSHPKGLDWVKGQPEYDPKGEMMAPGFKVFHMIDIDFRSQCLTLKNGLQQLKVWSDAHPDHNPVFITIEPKDDVSENKEVTKPEPFTNETFEALDREFLDYLGDEKIITPDKVRGKYATLDEAVRHSSWPTLKQARGKFLFLLDNRDAKRAMYMKGHPSLKHRVLFTSADVSTPEAAMMIINNPRDPQIPQLVKQGYIIRTRADADTKQARTSDYSDFIAAQNSGAQIITTDYYKKSNHFKSDYIIAFDGADKYFRVNPVIK